MPNFAGLSLARTLWCTCPCDQQRNNCTDDGSDHAGGADVEVIVECAVSEGSLRSLNQSDPGPLSLSEVVRTTSRSGAVGQHRPSSGGRTLRLPHRGGGPSKSGLARTTPRRPHPRSVVKFAMPVRRDRRPMRVPQRSAEQLRTRHQGSAPRQLMRSNRELSRSRKLAERVAGQLASYRQLRMTELIGC